MPREERPVCAAMRKKLLDRLGYNETGDDALEPLERELLECVSMEDMAALLGVVPLHLSTPHTRCSISFPECESAEKETDFVRELCISLFGQWEPDRLFMIFFGRIDESDTHGKEPDIVMSALLGSAGQWERVRRNLTPLQNDYGFTVFHGTQFKHLEGEFAGWGEQKCRSLLADFGALVANRLTECITITCSYEMYRYFLETKPPKMHRTSQYGLCFIAILDGLIKYTMEAGRQHRLSVIVESGHENAPDTARLFKEKQVQFEEAGHDLLRTHTLARKEDDHLLMLADATAYGSAIEARLRRSGHLRPFTDSPNARGPRKGETGWTVGEMSRGFIDTLIGHFNEERAAKQEQYFRRKQAWLDAKKISEEQS